MAYCTQSDIENVFGTENVKTWSNLENDVDEVDSDRVAAAIAYADEAVDRRFRDSKYAVPLTALSGSLVDITDIAAKIAGAWLYESRGIDRGDLSGDDNPNHVMNLKRQADRQINRYLAGQDQLPALLASRGVQAPFVV